MKHPLAVANLKKPFFRYEPFSSIGATVGVFFLSQIVAAIMVGTYPLLMNWTDKQAASWLETSVVAQFAYILLAEVIAVALVLHLIKRAGVTKARIGWLSFRPSDAGYAAVAYGLYFVAYVVLATVASALFTSLDMNQEQQVGFDSAYVAWQLTLTFVSLVILPPIAEEIIFRGFLFTSLRAKYKFHTATVITSIMFGVAHLQFGADAPLLWLAALDTFILSYFLCYLREKTGSLWAPIFLHAVKNFIAFMVLFGDRF